MVAPKRFSRSQVATSIAIVFHAAGLAGMLLFKSNAVIHASAFNLLLCFALLIWTQEEKNSSFWFFTIIVIIAGFVAELIGVRTGWLFGNYSYGSTLGFSLLNVPLVTGINWFIVIYCCGITVEMFLQRIRLSSNQPAAELPTKIKAASIVIDGALLAVFLDWLMEPVAVKLGFWKWKDGNIPSYNYISWFLVSVLLLVLFEWLKFSHRNKFAINLLLIQLMFFLLLRIFYQAD